MTGQDCFPDIENGCTEACKAKMIKYTQYVFKNYMNSVCWYYHDVKILEDYNGNIDYGYSSFSDYKSSIVNGFKEEHSRYFNYTPQLEEGTSKFPDYPNVLNDDNNNNQQQ
ncbi:hypothetical protein DICPUDRAFT_77031 [Dictyostelium purpureum]|uniref:Uncharacterized protein n=1 Tax=Dictyostelium purpureum TaxID=5786 RepID=F0ZFE3_DICPU|nr:uncharacterized protein DICPUDRAFT_77031 [Dictyostelium purpureum]EGC37319.1 hypothetical protein DICPUDRAFT_77031 [Dictyostelium purpureum]|eukprot:XP_003286133.1 hypothetical protein DICPUDRAFT_77031 [Dictyostelium purpureum]